MVQTTLRNESPTKDFLMIRDVRAVRARQDPLRCSCSQFMLVRRAAPLRFTT
jgi:hypothetical protein